MGWKSVFAYVLKPCGRKMIQTWKASYSPRKNVAEVSAQSQRRTAASQQRSEYLVSPFSKESTEHTATCFLARMLGAIAHKGDKGLLFSNQLHVPAGLLEFYKTACHRAWCCVAGLPGFSILERPGVCVPFKKRSLGHNNICHLHQGSIQSGVGSVCNKQKRPWRDWERDGERRQSGREWGALPW